MNINRKFSLFLLIILLSFGFNFTSFAQKSTRSQKGTASWYGSKYHGKTTSSGEPYNKHSMTAAHRVLPFGTKVKVTNLSNNKSVIVRINDRGPFSGNRIIDVSEAAARKLDFIDDGLGKVSVEVIELPDATASTDNNTASAYTIKTGFYTEYAHAQELSQKLKAFDKSLTVELTEESVNGKKMHLINAGRFGNQQEAEAFNELLEEEGLHGIVRGV
ncbi:septal ring lytic transglycosylase RlpA family protein [Botryobacter ruber]|uniref:septal ring lytic transglycosylase RlpA family protein n=1 Tax=Botryobacter ruber TaxID=2171629 RepID=UPI000E0A757A|nr:septal ring lytic transglycosylase RlpA family protein [Botryobacter ruber]